MEEFTQCVLTGKPAKITEGIVKFVGAGKAQLNEELNLFLIEDKMLDDLNLNLPIFKVDKELQESVMLE